MKEGEDAMAQQLSDKVLAWLYSVLHEYQDPQRTYSDAARTLSSYPSLSPRTEVYTHEDGSSALLLTISGTLPVTFRGATYKFPVKIWLPKAYPHDPPITYVTPGRDMLVRPGQHVGVDGRIYHSYLRDWQRMWDRASLAEFLEYLQQVFAKEPPVISRAQQQQYYQRNVGGAMPQSQSAAVAPPPRPPKPGEVPSASTPQPPPRPPKPGEEYADHLPQRTSSRQANRDGPPLPPLPHERPVSQQYTSSPQYQNGYAGPSHHMHQKNVSLPQVPGYANGRPFGQHFPPQLQPPQQYEQQRPSNSRSPVSPVSPISSHAQPVEQRYLSGTRQSQIPHQSRHDVRQHPPPPGQSYGQQIAQYHPQHKQHVQTRTQYPPGQHYQHQSVPQPKPQPPPDLLSDPFDVALPTSDSNHASAPAPPIPPNPEREYLLNALSATLTQQAQAKLTQNLSAVAPLQAQAAALQTAHCNLQNEIRQLEALTHTIDSNTQILHRSIAACDKLIASASSGSTPLPAVDELLVPQSLVAQQLWRVCAQGAGVKEAMGSLQRGLDRGRISGQDFVKAMRGLGREGFEAMVVARKCARGLGLEMAKGVMN
ncbi:hypothetical protein LTR62_002668 [Meristemomyces frigidus]|uniref:UEV domain-containing protein n=1 Tax=Meristemomyces frigidus TaxID=1508187 RepID=A0AAN7TFF5_9PEZI|nr:hypothetical protein LTR62_002668 [Meristemomyces frigidus]